MQVQPWENHAEQVSERAMRASFDEDENTSLRAKRAAKRSEEKRSELVATSVGVAGSLRLLLASLASRN